MKPTYIHKYILLLLLFGFLFPRQAAALIVDAGRDTVLICPGTELLLGGEPTASEGKAPYSYKWMQPNGTVFSDSANPMVRPQRPTVYTVEVTDASGFTCEDMVEVRFEIELGLGAEGDFGDITGDEPDNLFLIPAHHQSQNEAGNSQLGINLFAVLTVRGDSVVPPRKVTWEVFPFSSNQGATQVKIKDLNVAGSSFQTNKLDSALVISTGSLVQLDYTFDHPRENTNWVRAGDRFRIVVKAGTSQQNCDIEKEMTLVIVPGKQTFHITNPGAAPDPEQMWQLSDGEFHNQFKDFRFDPPVNSDESGTITVYLYDRFRNALEEGRIASWRLDGAGRFGNDCVRLFGPVPNQQRSRLNALGGTSIVFTQDKYPHCPWQPEHVHVPSAFYINDQLVNTSKTHRTEPIPQPPPPPRLDVPTRAPIPDPNIFLRETVEFEVALRQAGRAIPGAELAFSSLNGKLNPENGLVVTDLLGKARVTLTPESARPGQIRVIVNFNGESINLSPSALKWIDTNPFQVYAENYVVCGSVTRGGCLDVPTLTDEGEAAYGVPGAIEGDSMLKVPYYAGTPVTIDADPSHVYIVETEDPAAWSLGAYFPFDSIFQGLTDNRLGLPEATVVGAEKDTAHAVLGASFYFDGTDRVTIPDTPAVVLAPWKESTVSFYFRPENLDASPLIEVPGQYRIEMLQGGRLQIVYFARPNASAPTQTFTATGDSAVVAGEWTRVEAKFSGNRARMFYGRDGTTFATAYQLFPNMLPEPATDSVRVGSGFTGHIDELRFRSHAYSVPELLVAQGLTQGGTIETDPNGRASFYLQSQGVLNREVPAVKVNVVVYGSPGCSTEVYVTDTSVWGSLVNAGLAFLKGTEGLGRNPSGLEEAMAYASEVIPFASDIRTIAFEIYKAGSGCDEVSYMNVTFAVVGLVADLVSFGTAGTAMRAGITATKAILRKLLKEFAQGFGLVMLAKEAINKLVRLATEEITDAQGNTTTQPAAWVTYWLDQFNQLASWAKSGRFAGTFNAAFAGIGDVCSWTELFKTIGTNSSEIFFQALEDASR